MNGISITSFDDSINDSDYANILSPIEVSDLENMSEYERQNKNLCILQLRTILSYKNQTLH